MDYLDNYIKNTEEYERALSALLTPNGKRISEIAKEKHTQVSIDVLQHVSRYLVEEHILLIESDGKKSDPRLYRNNVMSMFKMVWKIYSIYGPDSLQERLKELEAEYNEYQERTGLESTQELLEAIKDKDVDLTHIEADDTGEIFWDLYTPWCNTESQIYYTKLTIKMSDEISDNIKNIDFNVSGSYGDFSNINAVRSKLGLEEQPPDDFTLNDDGTLTPP